MIPADIAAKLAKILPRLASEHDGEVVAAAHAMGRTLAAAGLDWHALARMIEIAPARFAPSSFPQRSSTSPDPGSEAPNAPCRRTGMRLRDTQTIEPWSRVARYTWMLDWTMPKAFGGRFLSKTDRDRLKGFEGDVSVTNADAAWIEAVVIQAHQAVEAWRNRGNAAA
ncbi:hypothetical protein MKK70_07975 [Methylobacterium sp. E-041]|uniref:hypothetical protein n=1 Tax=unclassified Methylobacterium TaxID=2615210 RepID=UPI001FB8BB32|nr:MULTISPECIES: hypothetical protein [unclassified Methylobacterium]MCJ2041654.1 hypothetical protein [Methylobacterium sp. J-059]MCJ2105321.1 hypothetical protein [Methylobacterium sp. E-041]